MSNVNANINITVDNSQALGQIRALQSQISSFNKTAAAAGGAATAQMNALNKALADAAQASGMFSARIVPTTAHIDRFSDSLDKGKLSLSQYARGIASQMPGARKVFEREFDTISKVAEERVKKLQTQYVALGNAQKALALQPTALDMGNLATQTALASQKQMIMNKMIADGSTKLVNWGKNTQWAGRQLMVGFTMPLTLFGATAAKVFMDLDRQARDFKRVYGDVFTPPAEIEQNLKAVEALALEYTKYGVTVKDTMQIAATAAAAGMRNQELMDGTQEALRLATIGQIDYNQALDTTISLQTAFQMSNEELAPTVDFLGAVANQTVLTIDDMTKAIPRVAPVIQGLGGDVKDLAAMLVAMREGGVSAENAANGLKSGLASLINPTNAAQNALMKLGIDIKAIVAANRGDLMGTINEFATALSKLNDFERQQALEKTFGKYQYARLGALFDNIIAKGGQAEVALTLAGKSAEELGALSAKSLKEIEESTTARFEGALERLKVSIAPIGESFLKALTPILEFIAKIADKFNNLPDVVKNVAMIMTAAIAGIGPIILMTVGLIANGIGNLIKFFQMIRKGFATIRGDASAFNYLAGAELDAAAAAASLEGRSEALTGTLLMQEAVVQRLVGLYQRLASSANAAARSMPTMLGGRTGGKGGQTPIKMARGGVVPGSGSGDKIPALLEPGESVVTKKASQKYGPVIAAMNAGNLPGFATGLTSYDLTLPTAGESITISAKPSQGMQAIIDQLKSFLSEEGRLDDRSRRSLEEVLRTISSQQTMTIDTLKALINEAGIEGVRVTHRPNELRTDVSTGAGSSPGGSRAVAISKAAERERLLAEEQALLERHFAGTLSPTQMSNLTQYQISHIEPRMITDEQGVTKKDYRDLSNLQLELGSVNNYLNRMKSALAKTMPDADLMQILMDNTNLTQQEILEELEKIRSGIAPADDRARRVALAFARLDEQLSAEVVATGNRRKNARTRLGTIASTGYTAEAYALVQGNLMRRGAYGTPGGNNPLLLSGLSQQLGVAGTQSGGIAAQNALGELNEVFERNSPAEAFAEAMDDAAEGMVVGAKRSSKTAGRAGKIVAQSARAAYRKEMSELRRDLRNVDVMERGGMKDATMQTRTLRRLKEAEARKEKASQSEIRASQQSAILAQINTKLAAQANSPTEQAGEAATQLAELMDDGDGRQNRDAAQGGGRMSRLRSRFGGGRMAGAGMGLMGVGMMAPMLPGQAGEIGSKIQPALMAISTLSMLGPLLGALLNPIGLLVVGVASAVAGVLLVKKMGDDVASKGKELAQAMNGTAQSMKDTAAFFGNKTWKEKLLETQIQAAGGKVATTEEKTQAQGYLESEAGQKLLSDIQMAREFGGTEMATTALQNQLKTMLLSGSIAPDMAIAIAQQIGTQLGSQDIAIDTTANLIRIVGADGRNLLDTDGRMKIIADIMADGTAFQNAMEQAGLIWDGSGWFSQVSMILSGAGTADIFAENLGAQIAAQQQIMSEEFSRLDQLFKTGKISVDEYTSSLSDLSTQLELTSYEGMLSEAFKKVEGFDESAADRFGQSIVDGLRENLSMTSLGAKGAEDFLNGFTETFSVQTSPGKGLSQTVNMFDPENVRQAIAEFNKQGIVGREKAAEIQEQFNATMNIALKIDSGELNAQDIANMIASGKKPKDIVQELGIKLNFPDKDTESLYYGAMRMVEKGGAAARLLTNYQATGDWKRVQELSNLFLEAGAKGLNVSAIFDVSGEKGLEEALDLVTKLDKIPTPITKEAVMKFLQVEDPGFWNSITGFENLKDYQVKEFVSLYRTLIANPEQISSIARAGAAGVGEGAIRGLNLPGISVADQEVIANQELINQVSGMEEPSDNAGTSAGGGGGDKELSGLQELWKNITEKLRLYTNFTDLMQKYKGQKNAFAKSIKQATYAGSIPDQLRQMNLSESLIADILEKGSKEARRILNALKTRKGLADQMSVADIVGKFGEATSQMVSESKIAQAQVNARGVLRSKKGRGVIENILGKGAQLTADEEQSLLSNEAVVNMINAGKFNKKQFTDFIAGLRSLSISESEMQSVDEILQSFIDKKRLQQEVDTYENKQIIKGLQDQLELIDRQIQSIEKKNEKDRQTIRGLERQKEMIQRQIDAIERQNELDQRRINNLKREDEIRNRVSEALSHELDIMGQQEQKIRESYEKRTQALEKVRSINEQITRQQQDQLNISRALASGDIYEATAAAQQMQQNQIGFAQQQTGQALQQGMENQIAGLRTESGLTRQQAEEQIRSIKEQSYQTSLLIQGIEDKIYERNLQIIPLKDAIYNIDLQIQAVNDQIYNRETEILNIQNNQRDPLLEKLQTEQDILDAKNEQYENEIGTLELAMAREKLAQTEINNANTLASIWRTIADQIADANKTMKKELTEAAGSAPQRQDYETSEDYSNAVTAHQNKLAGIRQRRDAAVAAAMERGKRATARGGAPETAYAGGYMDKKYAAGNYVLGSGGRDSIPAMLTPGEFVIRKAAVDKYGVPMLNSINMGAFRTGGPRYNVPDMFAGGTPRFNEANPIQMDAPVYNNYNVNVNVAGTNASADEIATRAIMKIKEMQNMQIRGNRAY